MADNEKNSEKLEIRLSHSEKLDLTAVAEAEGRTVSELVRGLISRYIKLDKTRLPEKKFWKRFWPIVTCLSVAALLIGHLATVAMFKLNHSGHPKIYSMELVLFSQDDGQSKVRLPVVARDGYASNLLMPHAGHELRVSVIVEEPAQELAVLQVNICRQESARCVEIANPKLNFNPSLRAEIHFGIEGEDEIYLRVEPDKRGDT